MFRHTLESYREAFDRKLIHDDNSVSVKSISNKYGLVLADAVAIKLDILKRYNIQEYSIIPNSNDFKQLKSE